MSKLLQKPTITQDSTNGLCRGNPLWLPLGTHKGYPYANDKDDNLVQRFEYADQRMPIAMTQNNQKYYLHYDQVGSLRAITDTNHNIIKEVSYDTFGKLLSDSHEAFKVPFGFAGGLYDSDTKLTRFGYRDYDAYTGKWTAKDPIGFDGGDSNLYGYVLGDPVGGIDPMGLSKLTITLTNGTIISIDNPSASHMMYKLNTLDNHSISLFQLMGHGNTASVCISEDINCDSLTQLRHPNPNKHLNCGHL